MKSTEPDRTAKSREEILQLSSEELLHLLEAEEGSLDTELALRALRSPHLDRKGVLVILRRLEQRLDYQLKLELARHAKTPEPRAISLLATLYWRDLARLARDVRTRPVIRRAAEKQVVERLPGLALGERIALARIASGQILAALLHDSRPEVVRVLLDNPRATEPLVVRLASSRAAPGAVLDLLAGQPRWARRREVRMALVRNTRTPQARALALLAGLPKPDLRGVARNPALAPAVRRRAALLAGSAAEGLPS